MEKKFKETKQKQLILSELKKLKTHPTAEEFYKVIKPIMPSIGVATVYRNLENFSKTGEVLKLPGRVVRYDGDVVKHSHIMCSSCGKVDDIFIDDKDVNKSLDKIKDLGYKVLRDKGFLLFGICPSCSKENKN